ncbi:proteophosphoglycan precursor [Azospirillum thiophilum]|uniref:Proteophosphoglycan n=1 Tax=Azospirillum thiophilum TaxID=528244 RepID=A0AAC8ZUG1_9PROT|nr:proteophosphoglycan precursor [Azospirillum thiophilum]KJR66971.1 proteophosphoglycan precursor [Azospirillum thiophilum]
MAAAGIPVVLGRTPTEESYDIRIARDGTWFHNGDPIRRIELAKLFSTVLRRDDDGDYWLVTPVERGRIQVEDAPFVAVEMIVAGSGADQVLSFRTNLDHWVEAGAEHPIRVAVDPETGEPAPYIEIRSRLEALILRSVFYDMVERSETRRTETGESEVGLWSKKVFFALGRLPGD